MRAKRFIAVLLTICMLATFAPTAFATTQGFRDFPTGWSKEAMTAAVSNGLLVGVNATEIRPTANLTRAELATIIVRAFGARTKADISAFADVPANAWYYDYISKAVKMEALYGKGESTMAPEQNITREEVFTALARILVLESDNASVLSKFKDHAEISDWAVKSISALVEKGYVNGDNHGNLNPKANITREEFAQVMHNMIKVYITKPGIYTEDLNGITVLRVGGVTFKNMKNVNDLVAGDGVGFDEVKLEDVEIEGRLLTRGGEFTLKRTTVSENVVVKNVNGVVHFNNYRTEDVFSDINEITKATFLKRATGGSGSSPVIPSEKVTIKFEADGVEVKTMEFNKGDKFTSLPDIPAKTGYIPLGWYIGSTKVNIGDTVPSGDITIIAKYEVKKHTVTFNLNGGATADGKTEIVKENVPYGTLLSTIVPTDFTKDGWAFAGWDPAIEGNTKLGDAPATYTAQWSQTDAQYTIKHVLEKLDGTYDESAAEIEYKIGKIGQFTQAVAKTYEGFTALSFSQETITLSGATVVIKYERNKHTVTFDKGNGEALITLSDVKYGTLISSIAPSGFTKTNHEFKGWNPSVNADTTLGDKDTDYIAVWEKTHSDYVVKHVRENLDGTYDDTLVETEAKNGKIGEDTAAATKDYEGFNALSFAQAKIPETDDLIITIKYERNKHDVTFKLDNSEADIVRNDVKFGTLISNIAPKYPDDFSKNGWYFIGWSPAINSDTALGDDDAVYTAQWSKENAAYTVKHIRETLDGNYNATDADHYFEETLNGKVSTLTQAVAKTYEGFTALSFSQETIAASGTVVTIKYERNKFDVTFNIDSGVAPIIVPNVKYGTLISSILPEYPDDFSKPGWEFKGWDPEILATTVLGNAPAAYTAVWEQKTVNFNIKLVLEGLNPGDLPEIQTIPQTGLAGNTIQVHARAIVGFTPDAAVKDVTISEYGTTVVTFNYTRNKHDVTFKLDNGEADVVRNDVKFGTLISNIVPTGFTKDDHEFKGWNPAIDDTTTLGDAPATYAAVWEKVNATYVVKHIREGLDGSYDETVTELYEEETLDGQVDELTQAVEKTYEGFTALSFSQETIEADDSTVVTIKYERNKYDVTFVLDNGEADVVINNVKYGAAIEPLAPQNVEKVGHIFDRWDPEFDSTTVMPDEEVTYTALWTPEKYKVRFGIGKYGNMKVTYETEADYGTTIDEAIIDAQKTYTSSLYGYVKKADYAPFYNNEVHKTNSDYWYLDDEGKWQLFDENVVITKDTDVYAWYKYFKVQLTVPQLTSLSPPLLVTYNPDETRIADTAKDLLYATNSVWIKNFVLEDKYLELREKAFEKAAKTGIIDEYGQIMVNKLPVKITDVIKPEEIHAEVKEYIRDTITDENKLDQIFSMVTPAELVELIGTEELIGMLTNQQIADIINGMNSDDVVDLIIAYPDVKDIVIDALKKLITPDENGNVANITLRNKVIAQIEHQLATDGVIREHILGDLVLLDWVLTSFESDIEDKAVNEDEFIKAIMANGDIRVAMIDKLLANPAFIDVLKGNTTLKTHLLNAIKGDIGDDILAMLDPATGNPALKDAILDEIKGNDDLLDSLKGNMSDSILNAMGGFGTSADLKAYALHVIKTHYGIASSYTGTNYSGVVPDSLIDDKIAELENQIRTSDLKAYVLHLVKGYYGISSSYTGEDYSDIISATEINSLIAEKEAEIRNSNIKAYVLHLVKGYYGISSSYTGEDFSGVITDAEIQSIIAEKEDEIRNSDIKDYVLHIIKEYYGISSSYTGEDFSGVITDAEIQSIIAEKEDEIRNSDIKDYVLHVAKLYYSMSSDYTGEIYDSIISSSEITGIITEKEDEIRNSDIKEYVLDAVKDRYGIYSDYTGEDYSSIISDSEINSMISDKETEIAGLTLKEYVIHVAKEKYGITSEYGGEIYSNLLSDQIIYDKLAQLESEVRAQPEMSGLPDDAVYNAVITVIEEKWNTEILPGFMADAVVNGIEANWDDILDDYLSDAVITGIEDNWDDILDDYLSDAVIEGVEDNWDDILDDYLSDAVIKGIEDNWNNILDDYLPDAVIKGIEDNWDDVIDEYLSDAVIKGIEDEWDTIFGVVTDTESIAYKVDEYKKGAIDAFVTNNGDLTGTDYEAVQSMIDDAIIDFIVDYINGASLDGEVESLVAEVMMDFALQDVDSVTNPEIKSLLIEAQDTFKQKAKELDADTVVSEFIKFRDKDPANKLVIKNAIDENYSTIIGYVESSLFDANGDLDTDGDIYKMIDKMLAEEAEEIPYDTFAGLLNMLLNNDSDIVAEYFSDFVDNPDNADIVKEQVENYIAEGNIDAAFVESHRTQIENALKNEGIDISTYVTVDVIKGYINNLGGEEEKIAFADKIYESLLKVDAFNEFLSSFDKELDTFPIHKDNTLFVMGIADAIKAFDYDTIMLMVEERLPDNKFLDKAIELFGDKVLRDMYNEAQTNYYQGIVDIIDEIEADEAAGVEPKRYEYPTSLTFRLNIVKLLREAYDTATSKAYELLDKKNIDYTSNQYLNYLLTNDYLDELLYDTGMGENGEYTGYDLKYEEEYAEMVVKYAILIDDAICWYGDTYTEEQINTILSAVLNKTFGLHDKLNELLVEYRATGDLPEQADKVLNGVEQLNKMFNKYQPQLDKIIDKYLASALNKHFDASDVLDKDKVQDGIDIMLGTDDPAFSIDFLYEIFYNYDDKVQGKLKKLIDSGKLEKAIKKFEETELVEIVGKFTDNSKVTSLAEKAEEIKNSGKVKTAFNSIYDLIVLIAEHGIEPFRVDEDVVTVEDAYEVSIKGIKLKIAREFNN